ncbi:hypothetical protein PENSPDRAFT_749076 [Peniophora sp. CONT]|nr:hypothetical protein PENSPDRAFT_749076 [Peniophora sp. CONT]
MKELHVHAQASPDAYNRVTRTRFNALMDSLNSSSEPANHLEVLSLKPTGYTGRVLIANFMKDRATALRRVSLERITLPFGITSSSLTSLELIETHCKSVSILLKTLETIPCLENLTLDHTSGMTSIASTSAVKPPIQLPHVRRLVIKNILLICTALVESMVVHPSAYTEIDASNTSHLHDGDLSDLANALFSAKQFEPTILDLVAYEGRTRCDVVAWGDEGDAGCYGPANAPHPTPSHPYPWPGIKAVLPVPIPLIDSPCSVAPIVLSDFLSPVSKATWGVITFKGHMHWDIAQVLTALVGANSVTALIVDDVPPDTVAALCSALAAIPHNAAPPVLSALSALHFENIDFGCPAEECDGGESAVHCVSHALMRHEGLRGRKLEILALISCSISGEYVEEWDCYVQELDWDGESGHAHDRHTDNEEDEDEEEQDEDDGSEDEKKVDIVIDDLD